MLPLPVTASISTSVPPLPHSLLNVGLGLGYWDHIGIAVTDGWWQSQRLRPCIFLRLLDLPQLLRSGVCRCFGFVSILLVFGVPIEVAAFLPTANS